MAPRIEHDHLHPYFFEDTTQFDKADWPKNFDDLCRLEKFIIDPNWSWSEGKGRFDEDDVARWIVLANGLRGFLLSRLQELRIAAREQEKIYSTRIRPPTIAMADRLAAVRVGDCLTGLKDVEALSFTEKFEDAWHKAEATVFLAERVEEKILSRFPGPISVPPE